VYKDHFGLLDEPFRMTPDTRYIFRSHRYEESLAALQYGIREKKGFIVITGEIGTGKTTLCRSLLNQLDPTIKTAVILNPGLNKTELLHAILDDLSLEVPAGSPTQKQLLDILNAFLIEQARSGGNVAVIIDESQNLDTEVLESIRMLSNLETEQEKLLQLILIGQPELNEILKSPKLEQLRQRIAVRYHITPLERDEIPKYIAHRLMVAGNEKCVEFSGAAIEAIADYTRGTPRLINIICDKCLLAAYALGTRSVDDEVAATAIEDHEGPAYQPPRAHPAALSRPAAGAREGQGVRTWFPESGRGGESGRGAHSVRDARGVRDAHSARGAEGRGRSLAPLIAASVLILTVLVIGLSASRSSTSAPAAPVAAGVSAGSSIASAVTELAGAAGARLATSSPGTDAGAAATSAPLAEILRLWGTDPSAASPDAAGLSAVRIVADLQTIARIDLPALVRFGGAGAVGAAAPARAEEEKALIEATATSFVFVDPSASTPDHRVVVPRFSFEAAGAVDARVLLPENWAYPGNVWTDPRLPALLDAALRSLTPEGFSVRAGVVGNLSGEQTRQAILRFQAAAGLPVDGVVGPITWCALVVRANPHYPRLAP
jgi:type II secretory pathway predicted ATPase ExeA/peptidoglycan hydrolase-like protein with peptidoglycan-binding domain